MTHDPRSSGPPPADEAAVRAIRRASLSIALATGLYAVSFGVLAVGAGFSIAQTCVLSAATFTGASQFTFVSIVSGGGGPAAALASSLLLAARNAVYGLSLGPVLDGSRWRRALRTHAVIDETTAMAHAQSDVTAARRAFDLTGVSLFITWNLGTVAGALAGQSLPDPDRLGLDAMFPAVFLALLATQLSAPGAPAAALGGALVALALVGVAPAGVPILAAALVAPPALLYARRRSGGRRP